MNSSQRAETNTSHWRPSIPGLAFPLLALWIALSPFTQVHQGFPVPGGLPSLTLDRVMLAGIAVLVLGHAAIERQALRFGRLELLMLVYLVAQAILLPLTAQDPKLALIDFLNVLVLPLIAFFLTRNLITSERRLRGLAVVLVSSAVPLALSGGYEHFTGQSLFTGELLWTDVGLGRAAGPLINPAVYGLALGCLIAIGFFVLLQTRAAWLRIVSLAAIGLSAAALFWTYTRSAWASTIIALVVLCLTDGRLRRLVLPLGLAAALVVTLNWPAIESSEVYQSRIADPENAYGRVESLDLQADVLISSPWLGLGRGVYNLQWRPTNDWVSHNTAMTMLLDGGLVQFLPYAAFIASILLSSLAAYRRLPARGYRSRALLGALWASAAAYLSTAMLIDTSYFVYPAVFFWFTLGLIAAVTDSTAVAKAHVERARRAPIAYQARPDWLHASRRRPAGGAATGQRAATRIPTPSGAQ